MSTLSMPAGEGADSATRSVPAPPRLTAAAGRCQLGDFSSIFSSGVFASGDKPPAPPAAPATPRRGTPASVRSPSARAPSTTPSVSQPISTSGFLRGLNLDTIASPDASARSTPFPPDTASEDDGDSVSDTDIDDPRVPSNVASAVMGDSLWDREFGVVIASPSTSPAAAMATPSANRLVDMAALKNAPLINTSGVAGAFAAAYPGQPKLTPSLPAPAPAVPAPAPPSPKRSPRRAKNALVAAPLPPPPPPPPHELNIPISKKIEDAMDLLQHERQLDRAMAGTCGEATRPLHIYVDMSNIMIGFIETIKERYNWGGYASVALSFYVLDKIFTRGRKVEPGRLVMVGSVGMKNTGRNSLAPRPPPEIVPEAKSLGYKVHILERVQAPDGEGNYKEQCVDELLHLQLCTSLIRSRVPSTIVLATGDAKEAEFSTGFYSYAVDALRIGWCVEVVSWKKGISKSWLELERQYASTGRVRIIELDRFIYSLAREAPRFYYG